MPDDFKDIVKQVQTTGQAINSDPTNTSVTHAYAKSVNESVKSPCKTSRFVCDSEVSNTPPEKK